MGDVHGASSEAPSVGGVHRGHALAEILIGAFLIAFILGVFGPSLDASRTYASYDYTPDQAADHRRLDRDAHRTCADLQARGDTTGYVIKSDGAVVCTDKRGRAHTAITIAVKAEGRP